VSVSLRWGVLLPLSTQSRSWSPARRLQLVCSLQLLGLAHGTGQGPKDTQPHSFASGTLQIQIKRLKSSYRGAGFTQCG